MARQGQSAASFFDINLTEGSVALVLLVLIATTIVAAPAAQAQSYSVLANFTGTNGNNPLYVTLDEAGNLYGTTYYGGRYGTSGPGTVFRLTRHASTWIFTSLYDFSGQADGGKPYGGVVFGPDGALYGTAASGGLYGYGVVYKLQPPPSRCTTVVCYWNGDGVVQLRPERRISPTGQPNLRSCGQHLRHGAIRRLRGCWRGV